MDAEAEGIFGDFLRKTIEVVIFNSTARAAEISIAATQPSGHSNLI